MVQRVVLKVHLTSRVPWLSLPAFLPFCPDPEQAESSLGTCIPSLHHPVARWVGWTTQAHWPALPPTGFARQRERAGEFTPWEHRKSAPGTHSLNWGLYLHSCTFIHSCIFIFRLIWLTQAPFLGIFRIQSCCRTGMGEEITEERKGKSILLKDPPQIVPHLRPWTVAVNLWHACSSGLFASLTAPKGSPSLP